MEDIQHDNKKNDPSELIILLPADLEEGVYTLTVCTQYTGGGKSLKATRIMSCQLTVGEPEDELGEPEDPII